MTVSSPARKSDDRNEQKFHIMDCSFIRGSGTPSTKALSVGGLFSSDWQATLLLSTGSGFQPKVATRRIREKWSSSNRGKIRTGLQE